MKQVSCVLIIACLQLLSCNEVAVPKPKAFLSLEYPDAVYKPIEANLPFTFKNNVALSKLNAIKYSNNGRTIGMELHYPKLKSTVFLTYKKIKKSNLTAYLRDAQNLTQKHTIKANEISQDAFENHEQKVYGMYYQVGGDAASQSQFYVTDSVNHFLTGSLYFYTKPNYDSILPAAAYVKKDIAKIMETIKWH